MRGTALSELVLMVKAEIGDNTTGNAARTAELKRLLSNKQKWLITAFDFPFLKHRWDVTLAAGDRYIDFPVVEENGTSYAINMERPAKVEIKYNEYWHRALYDVSSTEFNWVDSDRAQSLDPVMRWRFNDINRMEIWPIPSSTSTLRVTGTRDLRALSADDDVADLDDMLLVYFVSAELLQRYKSGDAPLKMELARERLRLIRMSYPSRDRRVILGGGTPSSCCRKVLVCRAATAAELGTEIDVLGTEAGEILGTEEGGMIIPE